MPLPGTVLTVLSNARQRVAVADDDDVRGTVATVLLDGQVAQPDRPLEAQLLDDHAARRRAARSSFQERPLPAGASKEAKIGG